LGLSLPVTAVCSPLRGLLVFNCTVESQKRCSCIKFAAFTPSPGTGRFQCHSGYPSGFVKGLSDCAVYFFAAAKCTLGTCSYKQNCNYGFQLMCDLWML
jgi:hypothetical protein